ncbi:GNAT family N-acetyltransferase [Roseibacterium sp. SDUM158016]|uniref:GNAT family N-acetyltransferase n=1 Tax=Roseicyclus sediminis TaxID=2980997 RepID=UPI0021CF9913|nr:GNAT family N-acetyltransferase [Roseibacterium sp. SDUM158016]MCU4651297.1 GNAT family N-acetyltransferase [Roseibacterium sp. SDUM158016]
MIRPDVPRHEQNPKGAAAAVAASVAATVPELMTERIVLRAPRVADFDAYAAIFGSGRAAALGGPLDREEAWADFTNYVAGWMLHGHGLWTIAERKAPGEVLGFVLVGLEPGDAEPELGYLLTEAAEGRGIATEAARATLSFAREGFGFDTLVSYVDHDNPRSGAVAARLGAARDTDAEAAFDHPVRVFRYPLSEDRP